MRIAYFDCPSGISGNMVLGTLINAGLDLAYLKKELHKILNHKFEMARQARHPSHPERNRGIRNKFQIRSAKIKKHNISSTHVSVIIKKEKTRRNLRDILTMIRKSGLSKNVKARSAMIFERLAEAEAKVHGIPVNKVHFHEVGALDAIVDIVGACIGIEKLRIEKIYCSPLPSGIGKIRHAHGILPNPAPATAELLKGFPTYGTSIKGELVTPTGAAIITTLADSFGDMPRLELESIGYGAGSIDLPIPNLLRIFIGEAQLPTEKDAVLQIETNIDDMDPKLYDHAIARIMKAGALDVCITPIRMKKKREAVTLTVLAEPEKKDKVLKAIFNETTTLGTRIYLTKREKLSREIKRFGKIRFKIGYLGREIKNIAPEYEDLKRYLNHR